MEISLIAIEQWMQKHVMLYSYNGKIFRNKKQCSTVTSDNINESQRHHEEVKSYSEYHILCNSTLSHSRRVKFTEAKMKTIGSRSESRPVGVGDKGKEKNLPRWWKYSDS